MKSIFILLLLLPIHLGHAQTLDLTQDELTTDNFNPATLLKTANRLIFCGDEVAYRSLMVYAESPQSGPESQYYVTWLFLCAYDPKPGQHFSPPGFGGPDFPYDFDGGAGRLAYPRFPLALYSDVPFQLSQGYFLGGIAESGEQFLDRCHKLANLKTRPFHIPTRPDARIALFGLIGSPQWKALKWESKDAEKDEIKFLRDQVERVSP